MALESVTVTSSKIRLRQSTRMRKTILAANFILIRFETTEP